MTVYLSLTFDYELFLGRNLASSDAVLFDPTDELLSVLSRCGTLATFFADVCSVGAHERVGDFEYPRKFATQLRGAVSAGHDVQLHVHPHWEYATQHDGAWIPRPGKMTLSDFADDEARPLDRILHDGVDRLVGLLRPVYPQYRCIAFRGPGLALQPREEAILRALAEAGIVLDSTVAKDYRFTNDYLTIDYRDCPVTPNWRMSPSHGIRRDVPGGIWQVPIMTFAPGLRDRVGFLVRRAARVTQIRGLSLATTPSSGRVMNMARLVAVNLRYLLPHSRLLLSPDTKGLTAGMLLKGLSDYTRQHADYDVVCASMIGHPKLLFAEQLEMLENFIRRSREELGVVYVTLSEALEILNQATS